MSWEYSQASGVLNFYGNFEWVGYSGDRMALNDAVFEGDPFTGPIPKGRYRMSVGFLPGRMPPVLELTPVGHSALGRSGFFIHGDNHNLNGTASKGCIILPPKVRKKMLQNLVKDSILDVIP